MKYVNINYGYYLSLLISFVSLILGAYFLIKYYDTTTVLKVGSLSVSYGSRNFVYLFYGSIFTGLLTRKKKF